MEEEKVARVEKRKGSPTRVTRSVLGIFSPLACRSNYVGGTVT